MSTVLDKLIDRASGEMKAPGRDMRKAIATAHSAATYAAIAERTGIMPKGLSRAERNDLKARVAEQLKYYDRFAAQAGDMSDAAVAARAGMYANAIRTTYAAERNPGLPFYPGQGTDCLTNCHCSWQDDGDGSFTWVLDAKESCTTCLDRASNNPYSIETKAIKAQTDQERAMFAKMGGGKGPGKGYDKSKSTLEGDKTKGGGGGSSSDAPLKGDEAKNALKQKVRLSTDERTSGYWYSGVGLA